MQYFFVLGNNPALSIAEIRAVLPRAKNSKNINGRVLILEHNEINAQKLITRLGGTIKIGIIAGEIEQGGKKNIFSLVKNLLDPRPGKFKFGISYYGRARVDVKSLAMDIKNYLRASGVSSRWVTSREATLSSVVVEQNKLTANGLELALIEAGGLLLLGKTLAVQPFKELSFRDYGRPGRDDLSGMVPPKLAQIMINLAGAKTDDVILDPFCGSGTILTEALLMGHNNLIGADISEKAIADTTKNIKWITAKFGLAETKPMLYRKSAASLSESVKPLAVDAIVTEPYLGPQRGRFDINKAVTELEKLYSDSLAEFKKILKPNGVIVMIWPVILPAKTARFLRPNLHGFKLVNYLPPDLSGQPNNLISPRKTLIYGRPGQKIHREIIILQKI